MSERHGALLPDQREDVAVLTANGEWLHKTAVTTVVRGHNFPVVWTAWPDEADDVGKWTPWPCEDVVVLEEHPDAITHAEWKARLEKSR